MGYPQLSYRFGDKKPSEPYMRGRWYSEHSSFAFDVGKEYESQYHSSAIYKCSNTNKTDRRVRIVNIRMK